MSWLQVVWLLEQSGLLPPGEPPFPQVMTARESGWLALNRGTGSWRTHWADVVLTDGVWIVLDHDS